MPLQATSGAASYDSFGGGAAAVPTYIEDVFSTHLYTGNGSTQTITNNIDITGKGALVWLKRRTGGTGYHVLTDTARGAGLNISTNDTIAEYNDGQPTFNSNGFNLINNNPDYNASASTYVSWTFRKQPKFFDVVTYTGNGTAGRTVAHNLGSVPGFIVVKRLNFISAWPAIHRGNGTNWQRFWLNLTNAGATPPSANFWGDGTSFVAPTSTNFTVGTDSELNANGSQYVAYLFAHNAGGFGLTGTDNVISCGSYTGNGSTTGPVINLGYEPQWVMIKSSSAGSAENWYVFDSMRGMVNGSGNDAYLIPNLANAEAATILISPTATGFTLEDGNTPVNRTSTTYIYIAIRRGPMKVPTVGTSVFKPLGTSPASTTSGVGFPADMSLAKYAVSSQDWLNSSRLTNKILYTNSTGAEDSIFGPAGPQPFDTQDGFKLTGISTTDYAFWAFKRAPSFFDEVCYTGDGTLTPIAHNLTVAPELVIVKRRSSANGWYVSQYLSAPSYGKLETTAAFVSQGSDYPVTATTFVPVANTSGQTFVAYLFATCAGVSKVGSYTGTATTLQINCGFTSGARFVLIKRTDSTGDWYVWDSARGIVAGNDPYLLLNSTAAEVTTTDYIDTYSAGFEISSTAPAAINASGGTFIFLAIA